MLKRPSLEERTSLADARSTGRSGVGRGGRVLLYIVFRINLSWKSSCVLSDSEINYECKLRLAGKLSPLHPDPTSCSSSFHLSSVLPPSSFPAFSPTEEIYLFAQSLTELERKFCGVLKRFNLKKKQQHVHEFLDVWPEERLKLNQKEKSYRLILTSDGMNS